MFEPHGRVEDVRVVRASSQGSEGEGDVGLVDMSCTREATNAKKMLDGVQLRGCPLSVSFDLQRRAQAPDPNAAQAPDPKVPRHERPPIIPRLPGTSNAAAPVGMPKIPGFYVPERWLREVHNHMVIKMRSVLWSSTDEDVRQFFSPIKLPPEAVEMGRDWEGRFSGQVYVRFRSSGDAQRAMEMRNTTMGGRPVQIQRVDPNNKVFFPPGANIFSPAAARAAYERAKADRERVELERFRMPGVAASGAPAVLDHASPPWREHGGREQAAREHASPRSAEGGMRAPGNAMPGRGERHAEPQERSRRAEQRSAAEEGHGEGHGERPGEGPGAECDRAEGRLPDGRRAEWAVEGGSQPSQRKAAEVGVRVQLAVGRQRVRAAEALAKSNVNEALDAVLHFLSHDPRLAPATRHAAGFFGVPPPRPASRRLAPRAAPRPTNSSPCARSRRAASSPASPPAPPPRATGNLRSSMLQEQLQRPCARNQHFFRSPLECAGVQAYTMAEVQRAYDTRSRDSPFWSLFQLFHTLVPTYVTPPAEEGQEACTLDDFLHSGGWGGAAATEG